MAMIIRGGSKPQELVIGDVTFTIKPLEWQERLDLGQYINQKHGKTVVDKHSYTKKLISVCVKDVKGITDQHGAKYTLSLNSSTGYLTDECVSELWQLNFLPEFLEKAIVIARSLVQDPKSKVKALKKRASKKKK